MNIFYCRHVFIKVHANLFQNEMTYKIAHYSCGGSFPRSQYKQCERNCILAIPWTFSFTRLCLPVKSFPLKWRPKSDCNCVKMYKYTVDTNPTIRTGLIFNGTKTRFRFGKHLHLKLMLLILSSHCCLAKSSLLEVWTNWLNGGKLYLLW